MWSLKPKIFTICPFLEKIYHPPMTNASIARWLVGVIAISHAELTCLIFHFLVFPSPWYFILYILLPFLIHYSPNSSLSIFSFLSIQNGCRVTGNLYLQNSLENIRNSTMSWARYVSSLKQRPPQTVRPLRRLVLRQCWILCSRWGLLLSARWMGLSDGVFGGGCIWEGSQALVPNPGRRGSTREAIQHGP